VNTLVVERRETTKESVENASQRPHIDALRVPLVLDDFRRGVTDGTARSHRRLVPDDLGETKVGDLDPTDSSATDAGKEFTLVFLLLVVWA
jgi:hypothetical protein